MKLLKNIGSVLLGIAFIPIAVALGLIVLVVVAVPMLIFAGIQELIYLLFRISRGDPKPKFPDVRPTFNPHDDSTEEEVIEAASQTIKDIQELVAQHGLKAKVTTKNERSVKEHDGDEFEIVAHATKTVTLSTANKNSLPVKIQLIYDAYKAEDSDIFHVYDACDEESGQVLGIFIEAEGQKPVMIYRENKAGRWLILAALRGDVKISKAKQVWFYLKEYDVWAVSYKGEWEIGFRKQFIDERVSRLGR